MNTLFLKIINMSISASWLILTLLLLRLIMRKMPKWVNVLLWGIVAVRLSCPFSIESGLSLIPSVETIPLNIEMDTTPTIESGISSIDNVVNPIISQSNKTVNVASVNPLQITVAILWNIWIIGVIVLFFYTVVSYWRLCRKVDTAVLYKDNIFRSENVSSPFVLGIIKPRIYLPFKVDGHNLEYIIAHEQAHINRKDHWWKSLGFLLLAIHWFNPLMWLAYVLLCRDIELACDEKVIKALNCEQRADYTHALVACSVNRCIIAACPLAFGEVGVKERVKSVMNYKKPTFWIILISVIMCVVVAVCFLTNPKEDSFCLRIVVPAGSQEQFVYADEEISPLGNYIIITSGDGLGDTEVFLKTVQVKTETAYEPTYLTPGMPVKMEAEKGAWFKVGVNIQNDTSEDKIVYVNVENVELRISSVSEERNSNNDNKESIKTDEESEVLEEKTNMELPSQEEYNAMLEGDRNAEDTSGVLGNDTWDFTDADSIQVINGNNGERVTFQKESTKGDFQEIIDMCQKLEITMNTEEMNRIGYNYCVIMYDEKGHQLRRITPYKDGYSIDDTLYKYSDSGNNNYDNASIKLLNYLDLLYYPAKEKDGIDENPLIATTEFVEPVNTILDVKMLMEKYNATEGDLEIVNYSGKELLTGRKFDIQMKVDGKWYRIEQLHDAVWEEVGYRLPNEQTTILNTQWSFVYGELPAGSYRIVKEVMDYRAPGAYDTYYLATEFEVRKDN